LNVLITAGGTVERIDSVRGITNFATGRLGSLIADRFAATGEADHICYICGKTSMKPQLSRQPSAVAVEIIEIEGTADLEAAIRSVLGSHRVDAVIHSMAVSDYRVKTVTTMERLAGNFAAGVLEASLHGSAGSCTAGPASSAPLNREAKISSDEDNLVLILEPTVKIISLFKELVPDAILVGFKLMDGVPRDTLLDTAGRLLEKNHCTFVLANDKRDIHGDTHVGYLIDRGYLPDRNRQVRRYETKAAIAGGITEQVIAAYKAKRSKSV
jgi:phosphopantothenate-cysteine ligase